ncbi:MAG: 5-guanidino-2-oxopentanoate decarboxylase [Pseudomonadota bacterium]
MKVNQDQSLPPTVGEALLEALKAYGVDHAFGVPGNHTVALYRGFNAAGIKHITCRHEQGAAFMADGYARAIGRPGVCVLISGPGLLNAATAIAQALADSIPLLVITGVAPVADLGMGRGTLHELPDQRATAASFCRSSHTLLDPDNLPTLIGAAFNAFATARPGPVHLEIPLDLMDERLSEPPAFKVPDLAPPGPDLEALKRAAQRLEASEQPLLLIGGGTQNASQEVTALAERLDAPVLNTTNGKGVVHRDHPLAVGGSPSLPCLRHALAEADLVLAIGTELGETDYDLLMAGPLKRPQQLLRIDIDSSALLSTFSPDLGLVADAAGACQVLLEYLPAEHDRQGNKRTSKLREAVHAETHFHEEVQAFFAALDRAAPDAVIVGDSTRPTYYASWQLETPAPRRYFHSVSGFGTLGYALPAGFGAAVAVAPEQSVIVLIGDGGIQFTLPELSTAAAEGLPVAVIVWHNEGYREIENSMAAKGVPADSTLIKAPDFAAAAAAHGADYRRPKDTTELEAAVREAHEASGPTLIEVREGEFLSTPSGGWYA